MNGGFPDVTAVILSMDGLTNGRVLDKPQTSLTEKFLITTCKILFVVRV